MQQLSIRLKLLPDPETRERLLALIRDVNECCNWISAEAWLAQKFKRFDIHHLTYRRARECFALRADQACQATSKVADAYARSKHRQRAFRADGAIGVHARDYRLNLEASAARLAVRDGRVSVAFAARPSDIGRLAANATGEARLGVARDGSLFLIVAISVPLPGIAAGGGCIGVDFGIANIATDSDGQRYSGAALRGIRHRRRSLRTKLQSKGTRSAKRRLKRMRRRESRFARDVNHCISKQLVATAERTKSALVLEDLTGIRRRVRATRREQRDELSSWSFGQLRQFVTYKAALAGVPVILVDPRNTSRECSACGHIDKRNRPDQKTFKCRSCGFTAHADFNAALVIRSRAPVNVPYATGFHGVASPSLGC